MNNLFDIVIPVGPCDLNQIQEQLKYTRRNIIGYRTIFLICCDTSLQFDDDIAVVPETIFPFSIQDVALLHTPHQRNGWYLQQLLKLYAGLVIPGILERYLVIDSDTYFLRPTSFVDDKTGKCLYNFGSEHHGPYFKHMGKLHRSLERQQEHKSGICHHMMFETKYIREMFDMIETEHNGKPFWRIFLQTVKPGNYGTNPIDASGASEYEIYFNYLLKYHANEIVVRALPWRNTNENPLHMQDNGLSYVSWHYYMR